MYVLDAKLSHLLLSYAVQHFGQLKLFLYIIINNWIEFKLTTATQLHTHHLTTDMPEGNLYMELTTFQDMMIEIKVFY